MSNQQNNQLRFPRVGFSPYVTDIMPRVPPWTAAAWAVAFPGFGHLYLGDIVRGLILILWELFMNVKSRLNLAILYAFTGRFELCKEVFDLRFGFLYMVVYLFSVWDSYQIAHDYNKFFLLAEQENYQTPAIRASTASFNFISRRSPFAACAWSTLVPGLGQIYCRHLPTGIFLLVWWSIIFNQANLTTGIYYTAVGAFSQATAAVRPDWLLFMPSLFFFAVGSTYQYSTYTNRLMEETQIRYLEKHYPGRNFALKPDSSERS